MSLNRQVFQQLAAERIKDAQALLAAGQWSGAFYLAGYAVECALKACIAKLTNQYDFPDKKFAVECYTHNVSDLLKSSGLQSVLNLDRKSNTDLEANWLIVQEWNESYRYELVAEPKARAIVEAVTEPNNGVLTWIMARW